MLSSSAIKKNRSSFMTARSYFDSLVFTPEAIRHLVAQVSAGQVVLGSDFPYPWQLQPVDHIFASESLSDDQKADILGRTATRLLKFTA